MNGLFSKIVPFMR